VYSGLSTGQFIEPSQHPKFKQLGDILFLAAIVTGIAIGITSTTGSVNRSYESPFVYNPIGGGVPNLVTGTIGTLPVAINALINPAFSGALGTFNTSMVAPTATQLGSLISFLGGASTIDTQYSAVYGAANSAAALSAGFSVPYPSFTVTGGLQNNLAGTLNAIAQVLGIIGESTDTLLRTFYTLIPAQQYALQ